MESEFKDSNSAVNQDMDSRIIDATKVIGIEIGALREIVREIVFEEVTKAAAHIISELRPSDIDLKEGKEYCTNDVARILGVTRNTIRNYRIEGILPEPSVNLSGRPVWSAEQIIRASRKKGIKTKFDV